MRSHGNGTPGWAVCGWIFVVIAALAVIFWGGIYYHLYVTTDAVLNTAQVSAKPKEMLKYLEDYKSSLKDNGMTNGYSSLIHSPETDMEVHCQRIDALIERLNEVEQMRTNSPEYQTALDDIRGIIREIPNPATGWAWVNCGVWFTLFMLIFGGIWIIGLVRNS